MNAESSDYRIVSSEMTVQAMRSNGYKKTAYALAELIDNSIDAGATRVEVFACENRDAKPGARHKVEKIAVLDNGTGMDSERLRRALKYGDGLGANRNRIGRFGMGLPNSSMSQCKTVEVWSWTNGPGNAMYTYLDLDEIIGGRNDVPVPERKALPEYWRNLSNEEPGQSGTLVVWSNLDKVQWHGAAATLGNTAELIGRVYRYYLHDGKVKIWMAPVREGKVINGAYWAAPNDPLYLMADTCTPPPFDDTPMFEPFNMGNEREAGVIDYPIHVDGVTHYVRIRASIARPEARRSDVEGKPWPDDANPNQQPGSQKWGKHAARNVGVSLVRQGRELDLDQSWIIAYDPVERWWGIEVEFSPELDDVFGVTNDKQRALVFSDLAGFDWEAEKEDGETPKAVKDRLAAEGDGRHVLFDLAQYIQEKLLRAIRRQLAQRAPSSPRRRRHDPAAARASDAVKRRQDDGLTGVTDERGQDATEKQKREEQVGALLKRSVDRDVAESLVDEGLVNDWKVRWISTPLDTSAFFGVELMAGMLQVNLNNEHPVHSQLIAALEDVPDDASLSDLRDRLSRVSEAFRLLIFSWARMEDEIPDANKRDRQKLKQAREDWGRYAREFMDDGSDDL